MRMMKVFLLPIVIAFFCSTSAPAQIDWNGFAAQVDMGIAQKASGMKNVEKARDTACKQDSDVARNRCERWYNQVLADRSDEMAILEGWRDALKKRTPDLQIRLDKVAKFNDFKVMEQLTTYEFEVAWNKFPGMVQAAKNEAGE